MTATRSMSTEHITPTMSYQPSPMMIADDDFLGSGSPSLHASQERFDDYSDSLVWDNSLSKENTLVPTTGTSRPDRVITGNYAGSKLLALTPHVFWVVLHCALLLVQRLHLESRIVLPLTEKSNTISSIITAVSQLFVVGFSSLSLFLTQRVAQQKILNSESFLTAAHDHTTAWIGLGSALATLYRQYSAILHVTTPSMLSLQPFNEIAQKNIPTNQYSNLGVPAAVVNGTFNYDWATTAEALGDTSLLNSTVSPMIGLHNNTLYDVISNSSGIGNTSVSALTFDVSCGTLWPENITASWIYGSLLHVLPASSSCSIGNIPNIQLEWEYQGYFCNFYIPPSLPLMDEKKSSCGNELDAIKPQFYYQYMNSSIIPACTKGDQSFNIPSSLIITSSIPFTDSNHSRGSIIPTLKDTSGNKLAETQIMGCTLSYQKHEAIVDVQTRQMIVSGERNIRKNSIWSLWQPSFHNVDAGTIDNNISTIWPAIFETNVDWIDGPVCFPTEQTETIYCVPTNLPVQEQYLLDCLPGYNASAPSSYNGTLEDLENALASITAAYFWNAIQLSPDDFFGNGTFDGTATITELILKYHLELNLIPVVVGLFASLSLLFAFLIITRGPLKQSSGPISSLDLLQIIWISQQHPELFQNIADVRFPSTENLRVAGMIPTRMDTRHRNAHSDLELTKNIIRPRQERMAEMMCRKNT